MQYELPPSFLAAYERAQRIANEFNRTYPRESIDAANEFIRQSQGITASAAAAAKHADRVTRILTPSLVRAAVDGIQHAERAQRLLDSLPASMFRAVLVEEVPAITSRDATVAIELLQSHLSPILGYLATPVASDDKLEELTVAVDTLRGELHQRLSRRAFDLIWDRLLAVIMVLLSVLMLRYAIRAEKNDETSSEREQEQVEFQREGNEEARQQTAAIDQLSTRVEELTTVLTRCSED